ncbi:GNAT family N-acetyltransferase [Streptomyces oceani]|uniref:GNAT family N-acetyltransferase n=1 Tax=Streptomyces oceani TaxID=1075402 RepID=UPI000A898BB4
MTDAEYATWRVRDVAGYSNVLADRGVPPERARAVASRELDTLLPEGPATSGMTLRTLEHDGAAVGGLWLCTDGAPRPEADAWAYAVEVPAGQRGRGHGRTLMLLAERECHAAGPRRLGLQVRVNNAPARRLYATLGYRTIERVLHKRLD